MPQQDSTTMRVPPVILIAVKQLATRLESITGRHPIYNRDALKVALIVAENATDEELASYLSEPELMP